MFSHKLRQINARSALALLACPLWAACATASSPESVPFTHDMIKRYNITNDTATSIQFYTGEDCTLEREIIDREGLVARGELVYRDDKTVEIVYIPKGTPGIGTAATENSVQVSFERGTFLNFGPPTGAPLGAGVVYELQITPKDGDPSCVLYDGNCYQQTSPGICHLKVSARNLKSDVRNPRTLPGITVPSAPGE
jgi:hypothetical protein